MSFFFSPRDYTYSPRSHSTGIQRRRRYRVRTTNHHEHFCKPPPPPPPKRATGAGFQMKAIGRWNKKKKRHKDILNKEPGDVVLYTKHDHHFHTHCGFLGTIYNPHKPSLKYVALIQDKFKEFEMCWTFEAGLAARALGDITHYPALSKVTREMSSRLIVAGEHGLIMIVPENDRRKQNKIDEKMWNVDLPPLPPPRSPKAAVEQAYFRPVFIGHRANEKDTDIIFRVHETELDGSVGKTLRFAVERRPKRKGQVKQTHESLMDSTPIKLEFYYSTSLLQHILISLDEIGKPELKKDLARNLCKYVSRTAACSARSRRIEFRRLCLLLLSLNSYILTHPSKLHLVCCMFFHVFLFNTFTHRYLTIEENSRESKGFAVLKFDLSRLRIEPVIIDGVPGAGQAGLNRRLAYSSCGGTSTGASPTGASPAKVVGPLTPTCLARENSSSHCSGAQRPKWAGTHLKILTTSEIDQTQKGAATNELLLYRARNVLTPDSVVLERRLGMVSGVCRVPGIMGSPRMNVHNSSMDRWRNKAMLPQQRLAALPPPTQKKKNVRRDAAFYQGKRAYERRRKKHASFLDHTNASQHGVWENRNTPRYLNDLLLSHDHRPHAGGGLSLWNKTQNKVSTTTFEPRSFRSPRTSTLKKVTFVETAKGDDNRPAVEVVYGNSTDAVRAAISIVRERATRDGVLGNTITPIFSVK